VILVIDNYDSFTFNLVGAFAAGGATVEVVRNDAIDRAGLDLLVADPALPLRAIVISPGPSDPEHAGISVEAVRFAAERALPLLGVCLGMQSIVVAFGGHIVRAPVLVHGEASDIRNDGEGLFEGMPDPFPAARYHSLAADQRDLPDDLIITARSPIDDVIMGLRHRSLPIVGVQFHPESILTPDGPRLLANFLRSCGESDGRALDAAGASFARSGLASVP
jgi:anthranilate synthase/aminodeoxychorismate synthase-like glutamine amidotransferase